MKSDIAFTWFSIKDLTDDTKRSLQFESRAFDRRCGKKNSIKFVYWMDFAYVQNDVFSSWIMVVVYIAKSLYWH